MQDEVDNEFVLSQVSEARNSSGNGRQCKILYAHLLLEIYELRSPSWLNHGPTGGHGGWLCSVKKQKSNRVM
jgi:hypothetical protein